MKLYQNKDWLYQKYVNERLSSGKISKICNASKSVICNWLKIYKIKVRRLLSNPDKDWLYQKYVNEKISGRKIGNLYGCCGTTIYKWLKTYGIKREKSPHFDEKWLRKKYINEKLSTKEIGICCGKAVNTIIFQMKKYGIKRRSTSEANRGKKVSEATKEKLSNKAKQRYANGQMPWLWKGGCSFRGPHSEESKKLMGIKNKGRKKSREEIEKTNLTKKKNYELNKNPYNSKEVLEDLYITKKLSMADIGKNIGISKATILGWLIRYNIPRRRGSDACTSNARKRIGDFHRGKKKTKAVLEKQRRGLKARPTRPEKIVDDITPDFVRYVGHGKFWRTLPDGKHKNPDFKIRGQNKVIEVWGDHWHRNESEQELINLYKEIGLECLIIRESEIGKGTLKSKINLQKVMLVAKRIDDFIYD